MELWRACSGNHGAIISGEDRTGKIHPDRSIAFPSAGDLLKGLFKGLPQQTVAGHSPNQQNGTRFKLCFRLAGLQYECIDDGLLLARYQIQNCFGNLPS